MRAQTVRKKDKEKSLPKAVFLPFSLDAVSPEISVINY